LSRGVKKTLRYDHDPSRKRTIVIEREKNQKKNFSEEKK